MQYRYGKPRWWQLYLLGGIVVGIFILIHYWHSSDQVHTTAEVGVVLCSFGVLQLWFANNEGALEHEDQEAELPPPTLAPPLTERQASYRRAIREHEALRHE